MPIIRARGLKEFLRPRRHTGRLGRLRTLFTRTYDRVVALDDVSFDVDEGELVGYIGPNGAGKSTTIKLLTGVLVPTAGELEVAGLVPARARHLNALNIGVVFGHRSQLWWDLPLEESLELIGRMYRLPDDVYRRNLARFVDVLGLAEFLHVPVRQLSLGQRMRGDLAAALLYEPRILYLDEPTIGLDAVARESVRTFIQQANATLRTTIILTTHDLRDVERLCPRIVLIDHGRVLYDGSVEAFKEHYAPYRVLSLRLVDSASDAPIEVTCAETIKRDGPRVWLRFRPEEVSSATLVSAVISRYAVNDISIVEPDLDEVVHGMYQTLPGQM